MFMCRSKWKSLCVSVLFVSGCSGELDSPPDEPEPTQHSSSDPVTAAPKQQQQGSGNSAAQGDSTAKTAASSHQTANSNAAASKVASPPVTNPGAKGPANQGTPLPPTPNPSSRSGGSGSVPTGPSGAVHSSDPRFARLLQRMRSELPRALGELTTSGRKSSHWAWWAWPTTKEGASEPSPKTAVTPASACAVFAHAPAVWQQVLEKVCDLARANGNSINGVIPSIDHGRIYYFVQFWQGICMSKGCCPSWFKAVLPVFASSNPFTP